MRPCADFQPETQAGTTQSSQGGRCIYLQQPRPKPCIQDGSASLTGRSQCPQHGGSVVGDGTVSVLQGESKNDAQTQSKTKHTGDRYRRQ